MLMKAKKMAKAQMYRKLLKPEYRGYRYWRVIQEIILPDGPSIDVREAVEKAFDLTRVSESGLASLKASFASALSREAKKGAIQTNGKGRYYRVKSDDKDKV